MFVKLLKHDFRSTWGLLGLLSLICMAASALGVLFLRVMGSDPLANQFSRILTVLGFVAVVFYLIAYSLASLIVLLGRFYKSRFTDEGYLTFTLPVSTHQILLSSIVNCFLGLFMCIVVTGAAFFCMVFFGLAELDGNRLEFLRVALQYLPGFLEQAGLVNLILVLCSLLAGIFSEILTIMLSITIGSLLAKKHKILAAIGVYYGIHFLQSAISLPRLFGTVQMYELAQVSFRSFLGTSILQMLLLSLFCYGAMYFLVNKKLNLN